MHACKVAELLGMETVIVPDAAGVSSAVGLLLAPLSFDFSQSLVSRLADVDLGRVDELLAGLESRGRGIVAEGGVSGDQAEIVRTADMRYVGQGARDPRAASRRESWRSGPMPPCRRLSTLPTAGRTAVSARGFRSRPYTGASPSSGPRPKLQTGVPEPRGTPLKGEREAFFDGRGRNRCRYSTATPCRQVSPKRAP